MKAIMVGIFGVLALLVVRQFLHDGFRTAVTSATTDKSAQCLTMLGSTTREEDGLTFIVGSIRNSCDRKFISVTISFKLNRPSGPTSSSAITLPDALILAYSRDVKPGETRQFKTLSHISKTTTYRFDGISGI